MKAAVSNYYTPNGNSINKVGIKPDVEVKFASELLNKTEISHEEDNFTAGGFKNAAINQHVR